MGLHAIREELDSAEFQLALQHLLDNDAIENEAAQGITREVISQGVDNLTPRQIEVFEKFVVERFLAVDCEHCGVDIPMSEVEMSWDNGGLCSWCDHMVNKDD